MEDYAMNYAEEYESHLPMPPGGKSTKKKKVTTVGRVRLGGTAWSSTTKVCAKGCGKKCCACP